MKIAYLDCFSGISGDMFIGALLDSGLDIADFRSELNKLNLGGYSVSAYKVTKSGIAGTKFSVNIERAESHHRHWPDIRELIETSELGGDVKGTSIRIFETLAEAEAEVHGVTVEDVHFHEVGAVDSIVDIVGGAIGLKLMDIETLYASKIHIGTGFVNTAHGKLPVPAPATARLLRDKPVYSTGIESEMVTPTGAALLSALCSGFGPIPEMTVVGTGYGAGSKDLPVPNMLRIIIGEKTDEGYERDEVVIIESNLDDVSPEIVGYTTEKLLANGALDVYVVPVYMKKNRPGVVLKVISSPEKADVLCEILFRETATLGIRLQNVIRKKLARRIERIDTSYGEIAIKLSTLGDKTINAVPEYEDCKRISVAMGIEFRLVYEEAKQKAASEFGI